MRWLFLAFLGFAALNGEILSLQLIWNPANCNQGCANLLTQQFQRIPGATSVAVSPNTGSANLTWAPNVPLTFSPINAAFSLVGPSIQDFRVSVRGMLTPMGNNFTLTSLGDNTQFLLLGVLQQTPGQWTVPYSYNPVNYPLSPQLLQQFSLASQQGQPVVVSGQILAPERSPPWMLIVRNVQVAAQVAPVGQPGYASPVPQPFVRNFPASPVQRPQPVQRQQPVQMQR